VFVALVLKGSSCLTCVFQAPAHIFEFVYFTIIVSEYVLLCVMSLLNAIYMVMSLSIFMYFCCVSEICRHNQRLTFGLIFVVLLVLYNVVIV
jgi:hypothetical protein